ncbi:phosphohydrolase [Salmonella enterica]|nr:phosphohydrolase [Salmonella enterica]EJK0523181.1 phosphohydrolase [Salmonella enterica]EJO1930482.1 phosphohydrolase [Salmonella enterica]
MNESERPKFAQSMAAIGEIYGKDISEVMIGIYWNALKPYPVEDVMRSFQGHTRDTDNGQFFPKPADLLRHIEGNKDGKALLAWSKAYKAICSYGRRNSVVFDDPTIHAVIADMGGWIEFAGMSEEELPFKSREFEKRYRSYLITGVSKCESVMIGMDDAQNMRAGFQREPMPFLIGEKDKAKLIRSGQALIENRWH